MPGLNSRSKNAKLQKTSDVRRKLPIWFDFTFLTNIVTLSNSKINVTPVSVLAATFHIPFLNKFKVKEVIYNIKKFNKCLLEPMFK